jgi:hypothetical protein
MHPYHPLCTSYSRGWLIRTLVAILVAGMVAATNNALHYWLHGAAGGWVCATQRKIEHIKQGLAVLRSFIGTLKFTVIWLR